MNTRNAQTDGSFQHHGCQPTAPTSKSEPPLPTLLAMHARLNDRIEWGEQLTFMLESLDARLRPSSDAVGMAPGIMKDESSGTIAALEATIGRLDAMLNRLSGVTDHLCSLS